MSYTPAPTLATDSTGDDKLTPETDATVATLLGALEDDDCRAILEATSDEALTTSELCERCALSKSSAYRKVDELTAAGLLEESVRLRPGKPHTSEYRLAISELEISLAGGELELSVTARESGQPAVTAD